MKSCYKEFHGTVKFVRYIGIQFFLRNLNNISEEDSLAFRYNEIFFVTGFSCIFKCKLKQIFFTNNI